MKISKRSISLLGLVAVLVISFGFTVSGQVTLAQDDDMMAITCDSTLATLLLVAEYNYDFLSAKTEMDMMDDPALHIDLGPLSPIAHEIMSAMMDMEDDAEMDMSAQDEMMESMIGMSAADAVNAYLSSMNMETVEMMPLPSGDVAGEDPACAEVRAEVEQFLLVHILTDISMDTMP